MAVLKTGLSCQPPPLTSPDPEDIKHPLVTRVREAFRKPRGWNQVVFEVLSNPNHSVGLVGSYLRRKGLDGYQEQASYCKLLEEQQQPLQKDTDFTKKRK